MRCVYQTWAFRERNPLQYTIYKTARPAIQPLAGYRYMACQFSLDSCMLNNNSKHSNSLLPDMYIVVSSCPHSVHGHHAQVTL